MIARLLAIAVLGSLLAAGAVKAPLGAADVQPIVIPSINSMTGSGAFIGKSDEETLRRLETAVNGTGGINGRPIRFQIYDDQSQPQVAVQLFNQILAGGSQFVLGPQLTNLCLAVLPLVQTKIVQYCMSPGVDPPKGSYTFAASVSGPAIFAAIVHYFHAKGWNRIAALTTADATGQQANQRLSGAVDRPENKGEKIVDQEQFAPTDLTVDAQVARIKAASPQVLIAWIIGSPFGTALRSLNNGAITIPVMASNANMALDQLKQWSSYLPPQVFFSGPAFLGGYIPRPQAGAIRRFLSVTKDAGVAPDFQLALGWDPAWILVSALRKLGPNASALQIHDYIESLHDFPGIMGSYDFTTGDQRGLSQKDMTILRWDAAHNDWIAVSKPGGDPL
jgi:branched-chain amino acid transport system substrate-binding protein